MDDVLVVYMDGGHYHVRKEAEGMVEAAMLRWMGNGLDSLVVLDLAAGSYAVVKASNLVGWERSDAASRAKDREVMRMMGEGEEEAWT